MRKHSKEVDGKKMAKFLWGDIWYDNEKRKFQKGNKTGDVRLVRSFVHFILEPVYKLITKSISSEP